MKTTCERVDVSHQYIFVFSSFRRRERTYFHPFDRDHLAMEPRELGATLRADGFYTKIPNAHRKKHCHARAVAEFPED